MEIEDAVAIFRQAHADEHAVFCSSGLEEPTKSLVKTGAPTDRVVRLLSTDGVSDGGFEALINLTKRQIDRLDRLPSAIAPYGYKDLGLAIHLTKSSCAMAGRGQSPRHPVRYRWGLGSHPDRPMARGRLSS